jgi:hypothetical protein
VPAVALSVRSAYLTTWLLLNHRQRRHGVSAHVRARDALTPRRSCCPRMRHSCPRVVSRVMRTATDGAVKSCIDSPREAQRHHYDDAQPASPAGISRTAERRRIVGITTTRWRGPGPGSMTNQCRDRETNTPLIRSSRKCTRSRHLGAGGWRCARSRVRRAGRQVKRRRTWRQPTRARPAQRRSRLPRGDHEARTTLEESGRRKSGSLANGGETPARRLYATYVGEPRPQHTSSTPRASHRWSFSRSRTRRRRRKRSRARNAIPRAIVLGPRAITDDNKVVTRFGRTSRSGSGRAADGRPCSSAIFSQRAGGVHRSSAMHYHRGPANMKGRHSNPSQRFLSPGSARSYPGC